MRSNERAIKLLKLETRRFFILRNEEYKNDIYEVELSQNEYIQIVHIFDVPHLIKCVRNNLLTKDLVFSMNGEKGRAKWSHIEELYSVDNALPDCKMLPRLTDCQCNARKNFENESKMCNTNIFATYVIHYAFFSM